MIAGAGPIGVACIEMARVVGAVRTIVTEPSGFQRATALEVGADHALDPLNLDPFESVREITRGECAIVASKPAEPDPA